MSVKRLSKKLGISVVFVMISNILILTLAMYWEMLSQSLILWIETAIFIVLQLSVILFHFIKPLNTKTEKCVYWMISETLTIITVGFWGFYIVGPIWAQ